VHILLSKADKLNRQEQNKALASVKQALKDYPGVSVQLFSSLKKTGMDDVEEVVVKWFAASAEDVELCPSDED